MMAYSYYPYAAQNYFSQGQQNTQQNALTWVQGEAGAKAYLVAPNTTVLLMDSEGSKFYLKSSDSSGMPNLREFSYTETTEKPGIPQKMSFAGEDTGYVTKHEFEALKRIVDDLAKMSEEGKSDE